MLNTLPLFFFSFFFWVRREEEHKLIALLFYSHKKIIIIIIALLFRSLENHKISIFILCCIWLLKKLEQPHQSVQNSCLFCKKNIFFFYFTFLLFYKTPTSVYLFYYLFYLNNNISLIFLLYQTNHYTHGPTHLFLFLLWDEDRWESNLTGREKIRIKKLFTHEQ